MLDGGVPMFQSASVLEAYLMLDGGVPDSECLMLDGGGPMFQTASAAAHAFKKVAVPQGKLLKKETELPFVSF